MESELKILYDTFWSSKGWKDGSISDEDFLKAKKARYMFDYPKTISHAETLGELQKVLNQINPAYIANAFIYSLSSRKLEYRSALGSYWYAASIPNHIPDYSNLCHICNWGGWNAIPNEYEKNYGLNILNYERYKWGGVRHTDLKYALFDLEQFLLLPLQTVTSDDLILLFDILHCINELKPHNKARKYCDLLVKKKILKANRTEISVLLDILGICGILSNDEFPCYDVKFVDSYYRSPPEHTNDFDYPLNRWKATDGVNKIRFEKVFGMPYKQTDKYEEP